MKIPDWLHCYGDPLYRGDCPSETADQITAIGMIKERWPSLHAIMIHPKNEGKRTPGQVHYERQMGGINKGASDMIFPASPPLVIELKRCDHTKSRWQPGQIDYLKACQEQGAFVCVALGWQGVIEAIETWIKQKGQ